MARKVGKKNGVEQLKHFRSYSCSHIYFRTCHSNAVDFAATFCHHQLKCSISSRDILCHKKVKRQTVCCNYIYAVKSVRRRRHRFCATIYFKHVPRPFIPKTFLLEKAFCFYVLYIARLSNELTKYIYWYETQLIWYYLKSNRLKYLITRCRMIVQKTIFETRYGHLHLNRNIHRLLMTCKDIFAKTNEINKILHFTMYYISVAFVCI